MWLLPLLFIIIPPALLLFNKVIAQEQFYAYILLATSFRTYTAEHLALWTYLKDAQGATYRLSTVLSHESERKDGKSIAPSVGDVEFKNVSFAYGDNVALKNVSFRIEKGAKTALIGLSGSGKSTILNLIEKFYTPTNGQILLGGVDVSTLDYKGYRSVISYLPQNMAIFSGTIREALSYLGDTAYTDEELYAALKKVGLYDDVMDLGGLDFETGYGGERLSGGQRQKLSAARLMLKRGEYVLLDEITSALDVDATKTVQNAIDESCKGKTQIIVAHDLSTVKNADKILLFSKGELACEGTHEQLFKESSLYRELVKEVKA